MGSVVPSKGWLNTGPVESVALEQGSLSRGTTRGRPMRQPDVAAPSCCVGCQVTPIYTQLQHARQNGAFPWQRLFYCITPCTLVITITTIITRAQYAQHSLHRSIGMISHRCVIPSPPSSSCSASQYSTQSPPRPSSTPSRKDGTLPRHTFHTRGFPSSSKPQKRSKVCPSVLGSVLVLQAERVHCLGRVAQVE